MGYYVKIIRNDFSIKKERGEEAYRAVCELNRYDDRKRGGRWGGNPSEKPADSKSVSSNPDKWFSWMPWNYDETCKNLAEVLEALGFGIEETEAEIRILDYDSKAGQEDLFLEALAPYVEPGSYLLWLGEDRCIWKQEFEDGRMTTTDY